MSQPIARKRLVAVGVVPFVYDDQAEGIEQRSAKGRIEFVGVVCREESDRSRQIKIEEGDFTIAPTSGRVGNDGARNRALKRVTTVDRSKSRVRLGFRRRFPDRPGSAPTRAMAVGHGLLRPGLPTWVLPGSFRL